MKRESGFYWVKYKGEWIVAKWNGFWFRTGVWKIDQDSDLEEIDERRIERTEVSGDEEMKKAINKLYGTKYGSDIDKNPEWT